MSSSGSSLRAIDTCYRGYRFRSRLEARWAVFLDTLRVPWEYEQQGFLLDGVPYLPDFHLPRQGAWLEVKGQDPARGSPELEKICGLARATDEPVYVAVGDPEQDDLRRVMPQSYLVPGYDWARCPSCTQAAIVDRNQFRFLRCAGAGLASLLGCGCFSERDGWSAPGWSVRQAKRLARGARFEHGETPSPRLPAIPRPTDSAIYLAGKIPQSGVCDAREGEGDAYFGECSCSGFAAQGCLSYDWRRELFANLDLEDPYDVIGQPLVPGLHADSHSITHGYRYAGPDLAMGHGQLGHRDIVDDCLRLLDRANVLFAWVNRPDVHGTLLEIGYARGRGIPIYVAYDSRHVEDLAGDGWFARSIADGWAAVPDVHLAWMLFEEWWAERSQL